MALRNYDVKDHRNLTKDVLQGLKEQSKDRSIVVCKGDKGNCVVLLKKEDFLSELEELLSDTRKFCLLKNDPTIKRENKLIHLLLKLKKEGTINDSLYDIKYDLLDLNLPGFMGYQKSIINSMLFSNPTTTNF